MHELRIVNYATMHLIFLIWKDVQSLVSICFVLIFRYVTVYLAWFSPKLSVAEAEILWVIQTVLNLSPLSSCDGLSKLFS